MNNLLLLLLLSASSSNGGHCLLLSASTNVQLIAYHISSPILLLRTVPGVKKPSNRKIRASASSTCNRKNDVNE
jgi:hypothetical protein